ncbi:hypothetical protein EJ377_04755 [Chryseobacterium arthrosphaerae]|uniref:Outer membrane protein beta-barrel domain-containing protein n=1 Tax=Chryseobacterium arthrosphaerae TaxID=651561 RepID=A0A3S0NPX1_9FLAO|nr:hypothetical protein EJ377_04755 [Chryseobacterium arthrosphaerae]
MRKILSYRLHFYKSNENHTFSLNYSKRINRPGFRAINPYRWYNNINSYLPEILFTAFH